MGLRLDTPDRFENEDVRAIMQTAPIELKEVLKELLEEHFPLVAAHLNSLDIDLATITLNWFLALFFDAVPFNVRGPQDHPVRTAVDFGAQGKRPRGAAKERWREKKNLTEIRATAEDALDRTTWRRLTKTADSATARD
ncbi:hypothetical protein TELCIR_01917 [Teladorsagia circumcincta]|uniref:Rab-GAP TBC domain-containing protein n=1 Tax=Teladorsagia circumcincta TaxID=45464 RepID=A0A2G9V0V4_TELCI|nr:hypothetical protein TELCIR_01917 [Teladorsagia circumcincta]